MRYSRNSKTQAIKASTSRGRALLEDLHRDSMSEDEYFEWLATIYSSEKVAEIRECNTRNKFIKYWNDKAITLAVKARLEKLKRSV